MQNLSYDEIVSLEAKGRLSGTVCHIADADYHRLKYVSSSLLKKTYFDLFTAKFYFEDDQLSPETHFRNGNMKPMEFGTKFHAAMLEGEFIEHMEITDHDKVKMVKMEHRMLTENTTWNDVTALGEPEVAYFWKNKLTGMMCKAKADWLNWSWGIADLKTMSKEVTSKTMHWRIVDYLHWRIVDYLYDLQAYHYLTGLAEVLPEVPRNFIFFFSSTIGDHGNGNAYFGENAMSSLTNTYLETMANLYEARETNLWQGKPAELMFEGVER
jgi:hypothetical protein